MIQSWCSVHGGYNNEDNACLLCRYDLLDTVTDKRLKESCSCNVKIIWGRHQNYIKDITAAKCQEHR